MWKGLNTSLYNGLYPTRLVSWVCTKSNPKS